MSAPMPNPTNRRREVLAEIAAQNEKLPAVDSNGQVIQPVVPDDAK